MGDVNKHWTVQNTNTLLKWITIGSYYIKVLEQNIADNRLIIRVNTIQSIALTTATGSIGVSQISSIFSAQNQMVLTMIFTVMSFFLTLSTGVIKVMLIHENLEKCIQVKQEWTSFITNISTELQLPKDERQDAVKLIRDNKLVYLSLLNKDIEINYTSERHAKEHIEDEIAHSKTELENDEKMNKTRKSGRNDDIINLEFLKKTTLHNDYSKIMNSVGVSISDITNNIVKTELQAIVELDLEAQREQIVQKENQLAKIRMNCELKYRHKELENKKTDKSADILLLTDSHRGYSSRASIEGSASSSTQKNTMNANDSMSESNDDMSIMESGLGLGSGSVSGSGSGSGTNTEPESGIGWRNVFGLG